jgi:hypothetical protein
MRQLLKEKVRTWMVNEHSVNCRQTLDR